MGKHQDFTFDLFIIWLLSSTWIPFSLSGKYWNSRWVSVFQFSVSILFQRVFRNCSDPLVCLCPSHSIILFTPNINCSPYWHGTEEIVTLYLTSSFVYFLNCSRCVELSSSCYSLAIAKKESSQLYCSRVFLLNHLVFKSVLTVLRCPPLNSSNTRYWCAFIVLLCFFLEK